MLISKILNNLLNQIKKDHELNTKSILLDIVILICYTKA